MASRAPSPQGGNTSTFSVRMREEDYTVLEQIAMLRGTSVAELAREFLLEGIRVALDPQEIERQIEQRKRKLLHAAEARRAQTPHA